VLAYQVVQEKRALNGCLSFPVGNQYFVTSKYQYQYQSFKYQYKYQYLTWKYKYKYQCLKMY